MKLVLSVIYSQQDLYLFCNKNVGFSFNISIDYKLTVTQILLTENTNIIHHFLTAHSRPNSFITHKWLVTHFWLRLDAINVSHSKKRVRKCETIE